MSKKERKRLAAQARGLWVCSPVTRKKESKKVYRRKKKIDEEC